MIERKELIESLEILRVAVCAYTPGTPRCDCKFSVAEAAQEHDLFGRKIKLPARGERGNGCPELRVMIGMLQRMSDREYKRLILGKPKRRRKKTNKKTSPSELSAWWEMMRAGRMKANEREDL